MSEIAKGLVWSFSLHVAFPERVVSLGFHVIIHQGNRYCRSGGNVVIDTRGFMLLTGTSISWRRDEIGLFFIKNVRL